MKKNILFVCLLQLSPFLFAQGTPKIDGGKYLDESMRLMNVAKKEYAGGNYEEAVKIAEEAINTAKLADKHSTFVLRSSDAKQKMAQAAEQLGKADKNGLKKSHPNEFWLAKEYYNLAFNANTQSKWDDAIRNSNMVINVLAGIRSNRMLLKDFVAHSPEKPSLPAQYTVRSWEKTYDCFWNIAARSWAYGDGRSWPILYKANKQKLTDPKNPNIIEVGTIIDIPSIKGERREGMWDSAKKYKPIKK